MQIYLRNTARPEALDSLGLGDGHWNMLSQALLSAVKLVHET